jgi:protein phosphatase
VIIPVPGDAMVVLIGIAGSGKSTFAARHFGASQVLSSDEFRAMVSDSERDQSATDDAFELLHSALGMRLRRGLLTVVDATNVETWARGQLLDIAAHVGRPSVAVVLDLPVEVCASRIAGGRGNRPVPRAALRRQHRELQRSLRGLPAEGFDAIHVLTADLADKVEIQVTP